MKHLTYFRLYTAGETSNSKRALANLSAVCRSHFANDCQVEVIDVLVDPQRARNDRVRVTPTLIMTSGPTQLRMVGTLSNAAEVLGALGLTSVAA